jgi:type IV fimbrial biogenesis protein FimT
MNSRNLARQRVQGLSLIELMITLAVLAFLLVIGAPSISEWLQNSQIRTGSESILSGLQTARNEAVRRNTNVEFRLANPTVAGGTGWTVLLANTGEQIQAASNSEGARNAIATPTPGGATAVTFNGFGRTPAAPNNVNPTDDSVLMTQIDIDSAVLSAAKSREMRILISAGGQILMCEPAVTEATDPRKCPP